MHSDEKQMNHEQSGQAMAMIDSTRRSESDQDDMVDCRCGFDLHDDYQILVGIVDVAKLIPIG